MKFQSEFKHFYSRKCIWKCRLRNGVHLSRPQYVKWSMIQMGLLFCKHQFNNIIPTLHIKIKRSELLIIRTVHQYNCFSNTHSVEDAEWGVCFKLSQFDTTDPFQYMPLCHVKRINASYEQAYHAFSNYVCVLTYHFTIVYQYNGAKKKGPLFCRRQFKMYFLELQCMNNFD